jgi:hypothetical protein
MEDPRVRQNKGDSDWSDRMSMPQPSTDKQIVPCLAAPSSSSHNVESIAARVEKGRLIPFYQYITLTARPRVVYGQEIVCASPRGTKSQRHVARLRSFPEPRPRRRAGGNNTSSEASHRYCGMSRLALVPVGFV